MTGWHWHASSLWRSVYLFAADILFSEYGHCKRVHRDWLRLRNQ